MSLIEIGPRFVLTPIRIFEGAFGGATVFANPGTSQIFVVLVSFVLIVVTRRICISLTSQVYKAHGERR
jgi:hypothetical protein